MNQNVLIAITVIGVLLLVFGLSFFIALAKSRKINASALIDQANAEIPLLTQIVNVLEAMLPPEFKAAAALVGGIIIKAITVAEQLKDAGNITAEQRKATAMDLIANGLKLEGITPNSKVNSVISNIVNVAANVLLPHQSVTSVTDAVPKYTGQVVGTVEDKGTSAESDAQTGAAAAANVKADTSSQTNNSSNQTVTSENSDLQSTANSQVADSTPADNTGSNISSSADEQSTPVQTAAAPQNITINVSVPANATAEQIAAAVQQAQAPQTAQAQ
jgi:hypothetical protein